MRGDRKRRLLRRDDGVAAALGRPWMRGGVKGVFGSLGDLRYSHLNPAFFSFGCLVDRVGPTGQCPTRTKNSSQPCPVKKLKSSFAPGQG